MTEQELRSVIHKQGLNDFSEVEVCALEPNGTFYVEAIKPMPGEAQIETLQQSLAKLTQEVREMRMLLASR